MIGRQTDGRKTAVHAGPRAHDRTDNALVGHAGRGAHDYQAEHRHVSCAPWGHLQKKGIFQKIPVFFKKILKIPKNWDENSPEKNLKNVQTQIKLKDFEKQFEKY